MRHSVKGAQGGLWKAVLSVMVLIAATAASARAAPLGLTAALETGHPLYVVTPGQEGNVAVVLKNATSQPVSATLHLRVESFDGSIERESAAVQIPANGTIRRPLSKKMLGRFGIKWVELRLEGGGRTASAYKKSFVYMKPSGPTSGRAEGFLFGIAYGAGKDNANERAALASALVGVKVVRGAPNWVRVQPRRGEWNWEYPDKILAVNSRYDIDVQWIFGGTPRWAVAPEAVGRSENTTRLPPRLDAWREYVTAVAERYRSYPHFWELWNEPDIDFFHGTIEEYLAMQRVAYEAIKKVDPRQRVMTGGFTSLQHARIKKGMLETTLRQAQPSFDFFAHHQHGEFSRFRRELDDNLLPLMKKHDALDKPLYFTETAMDTRYGEHHQAATLVKKVAFAWSRGAVAYTWFSLHDQPRAKHPREPGYTYGLLTKDGDPKASYAAYNTLTAALRGKKFAKQLALPDGQWGFLFQDDAEQVIVAWNEDAAQSAAHLVLETDASAIVTLDMMGNRVRTAPVSGRALLQVEETPHYLLLRGARREPQITSALAASSGTFHAVPGRTVRAETELHNPLNETRTFVVAWNLPKAFGGGTGRKTVKVAPHSRVRVPIEAPVPAGLRADYGDVEHVTVRYNVEGTSWSGTLRLPVVAGALAVPRGDFRTAPDFVLDRQEQAVNLTEADPNTEHLLWKGRADMNARVWLAHDGKALKLKVDVADNAFSQPGGARLWEGDSVQFALQAPGEEDSWQIALADANGQAAAQILGTPQGRKAGSGDLSFSVRRVKQAGRIYEVTLPDAKFGLTQQALEQGVRFNLLVNDNDGRGRKGWLEIAPGLGRNFAPKTFPVLVLEQNEGQTK